MRLYQSILLLLITSVLILSTEDLIANQSSQEQFVYLCNKPGQKCYYIIPCNELRETCNKVQGKLFKVPLSRAKQMKRTECECKDSQQ
jgi:hypothetical protein